MTLFGASDQQFTSVVTQMVGTARRLKSALESSPIRVPIEPAAPAAVTRGFGLGMKVFGNGVRGGGVGNEGGLGASLMGGLGAAGTMAAGLAGAAGASAMLVVGVNRVLGKVSEAGREQEKWTAEVMKTSSAYVQLATAAMKPLDPIRSARMEAIAESQKAAGEIAEKTRAGLGDDKNAFSRGFDRVMVNGAALLSRVPGVNSAYDFGDGRFYGEKQDEKARIGNEQMNRAALTGNAAAKKAEADARAKALKDAQDRFVTEGQAMSARAEAAQREAEARQKEVAAREKARALATEDMRVTEMSNKAVLERLAGRTKEADLLEANAAYLQRHLELERDINLTAEQRARLQEQAWKIYGGQQREIEKSYSGRARSVGIDLSTAGAAMAAMQGGGADDRLLKAVEKQTDVMKEIAVNTRELGVARFG